MLDPIGEHLQAAGLMSAEEVADILDVQRAEGGRFCSIALRRGLCTERDLVRTLARQLNVPGICIADVDMERGARALVPAELRERLGVQPDRISARSVTMLMRDPLDEAAVTELRECTQLVVRPAVVLEGPLMALIRGERLGRDPGEDGAVEPPGSPLAWPVSARPLTAPLPNQSVQSFSPASTVESPAPKIVVVGEDCAFRDDLVERLQSDGYAVIQSPPTAPLLERLHRHRPAALLLDDVLPAARSLDICQRVKSHSDLRQIRVILLTTRFRGWRARADLMKMYGLDEVIEVTGEPAVAANQLSRLVMGPSSSDPHQDALEAAAHRLFEDGLVALRTQRPDAAQRAFEESVLMDPQNPRPHYYSARIHDQAGRTFDALAAYEEAVRLEPTYLRALKAMALLQERTGFEHQAAGTWEQALSVCRDTTTRRAIRGHLLRLLR